MNWTQERRNTTDVQYMYVIMYFQIHLLCLVWYMKSLFISFSLKGEKCCLTWKIANVLINCEYMHLNEQHGFERTFLFLFLYLIYTDVFLKLTCCECPFAERWQEWMWLNEVLLKLLRYCPRGKNMKNLKEEKLCQWACAKLLLP